MVTVKNAQQRSEATGNGVSNKVANCLKAIAIALVLSLFLVSAACDDNNSSSGSTGTGTQQSQMGSATISLTDAPSDDIESFQIDVTAVTLTRASGAVSSVLDQTANVDLTELQELGDVLNIADLPVGLYTSASMTFDFSTASARLVGQTTDAALKDSAGNALTGLVSVPVSFGNSTINIVANRLTLVEFDFDLDTTVTVDTTANEISVEPTIVMKVDPTDAKSLILLGELVSVDTAATTFDMQLKRPNRPAIRTVTCASNSLTAFQINGDVLLGDAGLTALSGLATASRVQCYGATNPTTQQIDVSHVEAGTGTIGSGTDIVHGYVISRDVGAGQDPSLTVRGHSVNASGTRINFNTDFTVNLSLTNSKVVKRASTQSFSSDDINVGQAIRVFGSLTGTTISADTASDLTRLMPTRVSGFANGSISGGLLPVTVTRIGLRPVSNYNFTVNGNSQASMGNFSVSVGSAATSGITTNTPIQVDGFMTTVDSTGADFAATAITNFTNAPSAILLYYLPASTSAVTSATSSSISFGTDSAFIAKVNQGFVGAQNLSATPDTTIVPNTTAWFKLFILNNDGQVSLFSDFGEYVDELNAQLAAGKQLRRFSGVGSFDSTTNTLTTSFTSISVVE